MREGIDMCNENTHLRNKIINTYEYILEKFCKGLIKFEARIKGLKRGIILPNGEEYYEEYFTSTHTEIKEKINEKKKRIIRPQLMVIKIFTHQEEEIVFSTDIKSDILDKKIIYLDEALKTTPKLIRHLFYNKISELKAEERIFRQRKNIEKIQTVTQELILNGITAN